MQNTQNNGSKPFSPDKVTVVDFVPGFILINHSGELLKKYAIPSIEELVQKCGKEARQYSAFMAFRMILSPNFKLKYGDASIFYGKLWAKITPTLKKEMTRIGNIVKSKLKEKHLVFRHYTQDGTNDDVVTNINIDANNVNDVNTRTYAEPIDDIYDTAQTNSFNHMNTASYYYPIPANNMYVNVNPAVDTYFSLSYDAIYVGENFVYDNAFHQYSNSSVGGSIYGVELPNVDYQQD